MKRIIASALIAASPAAAADFSEGSTAKSWNLYAEAPAFFEAKVVDITCEVTGDCPDNCGDGNRQLGLLRAADGVLVFPNKNAQSGFQGATVDLLPFCGKSVEVDGLLIEDEDIKGASNIYQVQTIREAGTEDWTKANTWSKVWAAKYPEAKGKGPWFRRDPRVNAHLAETGHFGLGLEKDAELIKELFE
ncbi:hypothetical protein BDE40_0770 [Litoreibacter halocynthiae]|uniref:Uncharacterized protein n=1 Tax=Litoreibacter halocynthiae TaxID=1242689 RepID=A0A4R7LN71_9RHOB|nr:hypothetical protein [Litoreibacter halocynthiae]TDT77483.1 hypothetical protein BDE40_0770 [Litoreibacter halocynthiae]